MRRPLGLIAACLAACLLALPLAGTEAPAPKKALTLEAVSSLPPGSGGLRDAAWRDASRLTWTAREGEGEKAATALWEWNVASGKKTKLLDPIPLPDSEKTLSLSGAVWNKAGSALLFSGEKDLFLWDFTKKALTRLTKDEEEEEFPTFSPDGGKVAFVKKHDLWVFDLASKKSERLTHDGSDTVFNGRLDWVYEEELAERKSGRAYEWSPGGDAIAYLRLDDGPVPEALILDFLPTHAKLEPQRYPKAGDPNPIPSVHLVELSGEKATRATSVRYDSGDRLVAPELSFTADGRSVCYLVLDRVQTKLEAVLMDRVGVHRTLFIESDPAWINSLEPPRFLKDGSFLFLSERSGYLHLYRFAPDGTLKNAVTKGDWMIDRSWDLDEKAGWVYFLATEKDPRERHVYRARLDGSGRARLTPGHGTHSLLLAPDAAHFVDTWSDVKTPTSALLRRADGSEAARLSEPKNRLAEYALGSVELGSFRGKDGTLFYTKLLRPAGFDPARKYPVVVDVYGGPHAQTVRDSFGVFSPLDQLFASKGFLVFGLDNRGSWGRGHAFETPILKRTGARELSDQLEGVAWLKSQPFVEGSRIGIWGWSYGGFMAVYAATHAGAAFKCAVAGAPVTDWKYYDSIYTERYMRLPTENEEGYKASSVVEAAKDLSSDLLILHGTSDDNVHLQNSIAFADAAARARKDFVFVPLPRQKHGPRDPAMRLYTNQRVLEFLEEHLK